MSLVKEITRKEFKARFPERSTYGLDAVCPIYLENGEILIAPEWNGERYECNGHFYFPVEDLDDFRCE